jgi:hypothetical protein
VVLAASLGIGGVGEGLAYADVDHPDGGVCIERLTESGDPAKGIPVPAGACWVGVVGERSLAVLLGRAGEVRVYGRHQSGGTAVEGWDGSDSVGAFAPPVLPEGVGVVDAVTLWDRVLYLASDGAAVLTGGSGQAMATPGVAGVTCVGVAKGWGRELLLRSDNVVDVVKTEDGGSLGVVASVDLGLAAGRIAVKVAAGGYWGAVLDSGGDVRFFSTDGVHPVDSSKAMFRVPKLPRGLRYTDVFVGQQSWRWDYTLFVRSDGAVIARGEAPSAALFPGDGAVVSPPKGLRYKGFGHSAWLPVVYGSDGSARSLVAGDLCGDPPANEMCGPVVPSLAKGWVFVDGSSGTVTLLYGVARIPDGVRASSSVVEVVAPARGVVKGEPAVVKVRLGSRGWLRGGKVVVRSGGKVVGRATVGGSSSVKVKVATGRLSASKANRLSVQYLGNGYSSKSYRVGFTLKIRDR